MALSLIPGDILPAPAQCFSCGTIGVDMLDSGMNEAYYGAILICVTCFREAATRIPELELVTRKQYDETIALMVRQMGLVNQIGPAIKQLYSDLSAAMDNVRLTLTPSTDADITAALDAVDANQGGDTDQQYFFSIAELLRTAQD